MPNLSVLTETFLRHFGQSAESIYYFHAPGRVNLIGEHTDYNGGLVFPAALTIGTTLLIRKRHDDKLSFMSTNFQLHGEVKLSELNYMEEHGWMNYPKGIVSKLVEKGYSVTQGYDFLYEGEIPNGAGLSSSASIEVVTGYGILSLLQQPIDLVELALLAQKTENEYIGVNSGIMDQFAVANGKRGHAMKLMCDTLHYEHVPFETGSYKLIIANTNKRRTLVDSKYNERRAECDAAVLALREVYPTLNYLAQLTPQMLSEAETVIANEVLYRRAKHVVEEHARVLQSVEALKQNNLVTFGKLMNASHDSLKHLYEVTGDELDSLVEAAQQVEGVLGSRMTGAGFGGCTVSLVHEHSISSFIAEVGVAYTAKTGLEAHFYVCDIGAGVEQISY